MRNVSAAWRTRCCPTRGKRIPVWETDSTSKEAKYKSPKRVIDMLVDIVSRHGNLLLKFPLPNSGYLDSQELRTLSELTAWMAIKGDGIFSSRPRKNLMTFVLRCSEPACRPHPASLPVRVTSVDSLLHASFSFTSRLRFAARYGCRHRLRLAPFIPLDSAHAVHTPQADPGSSNRRAQDCSRWRTSRS